MGGGRGGRGKGRGEEGEGRGREGRGRGREGSLHHDAAQGLHQGKSGPGDNNKKLSYRKQIVRQLRTPYVDGISVTLKSIVRGHSRTFGTVL